MIIVHILGGLGNQMFQYAMGKALAYRNQHPLKLDIAGFKNFPLRKYELNVFNIDTEIASNKEIHHSQHNIFNYTEKHFHFDSTVINLNQSAFLRGYWQSEKYFVDYKEELLKDFTLKKELSTQSNQYQKIIKSTTSVSLHIRRGDYVTNPTTNSFHGTCSLEYYKNAVSLIINRLGKAHFFIFSDDLDWVQENLDFINEVTFIKLNHNIPDYEEMYLMSQCEHNIIANSSFSWWGAWLNKNPEKIVIAPKKWFIDETMNTKDLIPDSWIRLCDKLIGKDNLVSIIIPCYNQAQYLEEAVQSVINQTFPNIEIIIINDGSTDNTEEISEKLEKKYHNIRTLSQKNKGLSTARNNGISIASGKYILPLDSDDFIAKEMVLKCVTSIQKYNIDIISPDGQAFGKQSYKIIPQDFPECNLLYANCLLVCSLFRREVWTKTGGYKKNMEGGYEDWEFWINAYKHGFKFKRYPETLFHYRTKEVSMYTSAEKKDAYLKAKIVLNNPGLYPIVLVQESITIIKETEKLADVFFYFDKNIPDDEKIWITEVGYYIDNNQLEEKQIINIHNKKVGLCTLDSLKNDISIRKLYINMEVDYVLFYAPLRFELETLRISNYAWSKDKGIIKAHGNLFPFISKAKREDPKKQLIAYQRSLKYHTKKHQLILENNRSVLTTKETLIKAKDKEIEDKAYLIQKLYEENNQKSIQIETILNKIQKVIHFSIIKNPIQKYKAYKAMLKTYKKLKSFNDRMI